MQNYVSLEGIWVGQASIFYSAKDFGEMEQQRQSKGSGMDLSLVAPELLENLSQNL